MPASRTRLPSVPMLVAVALALILALVPAMSSSDIACAHDLRNLCTPDGVPTPVGPGDVVEKGTYRYRGGVPGVAGPAPTMAAAADDTQVKVLAHADPGGGFNADVVVHHDTAYLASWGTGNAATTCPSQGVRAYDLSTPTRPRQLDTFADAAGDPDVFGSWTEKVIVRSFRGPVFSGDMAVVSFQSCRGDRGFRGFGLYDVTDPAAVRRLALVRTENSANGSHEIWLDVRGGRAYVYTAIILSELTTSPDGTTPGKPDFRVFDVSHPRHPRQVGEWGAWAELGVPPVFRNRQGTTRVNFVHSVQSRGTRVYLSYWDLGTVILDMADPSQPRYVGRTKFRGREEGNAHSSWRAKQGRLLIQTDEDFSPEAGDDGAVQQSWGYPRFYSLADESRPKLLSTFKLPTTRQYPPRGPGFYTVHDPKVDGNLAYFSWYAEGVVIVNFANPSKPRMLARFKPPASPDPRGVFGTYTNVWGVALHDDYAVASDINSGLWVFRLRRR